MLARWLLVCGAVACLAMADEDVRALSFLEAPSDGPADRGECVGDLDGDGDTDWSDLCFLLYCVNSGDDIKRARLDAVKLRARMILKRWGRLYM